MRDGKKISKRKLNKWKASEKVRAEEVIPSNSGQGCFAPKYSHQAVPKSLLKVMQMSQAPTIKKQKHRCSGSKILSKQDRRFKQDTTATQCHLRHLRNTAKAESHEIQKKTEHTERIDASRRKKAKPELVERKTRISKMMKENRKWKMEEKKERRKAQLHAPKKRRPVESSDEDELVDRTGYDEVAFGEVAHAPPRFTSIEKHIDKLRRRQVRAKGMGAEEAEAEDVLCGLAP